MNANLGFALAILSGALAGSFSLPMKKTTGWAWENTWLVWAVVGLLITPWTIAWLTVPRLLTVYAQAGPLVLGMVFLFGAGWGLGAVLFGQGIALIGISLSFAICIGLTTALGALVPMAMHPAVFLTPGGMTVAAGIAAMVAGVVLCAVAGGKKEARINQARGTAAAPGAAPGAGAPAGVFVKGLLLSIFGGVFSSMINFAFNFGGRIMDEAVHAGATKTAASDALWAFTMLGGLATNCIYCAALLSRNRTWPRYGAGGTRHYWLLAAVMGVTWFLSVTVYGRAAAMMGSLGGSAGWAIYMGGCILVSNSWGIVSGEWREGRGQPLRLMMAGQAVLLAAIVLIGVGNALPK